MRLSLIVAMNPQRVIGRQGELPWRLSSDLKRFKQLTMGHHLIMGRTTFESIGRPLPGRTSLVLSRREETQYKQSSVYQLPSLEAAIRHAAKAGDDEAFVIGGGQIYRLALPKVQRMYLTLVECDTSGDTHFPPFEASDWELLSEERYPADAKNEHPSAFLIYQRR